MALAGKNPRRPGVIRRASWGMFDQVLSSASNFALSAFVAAMVSATEFGAFTLAYAIYNLILAISAGLASLPLVVRYSAAAPDRYRAATRASAGIALVVGTLGGILCLIAAAGTTSALSGSLAALGVTLPGLLVQDNWRYGFVTGGQPAKAAANDGLWIALQLLGIAVLLTTDSVSAMSMVLVWGGSGSVAGLFGCWQAAALPAPRQMFNWLRDERALTWRYAGEVVVNRSGTWVVLSVVGVVAGIRVVGALRGAMLLVAGPLNLLFMGATFAFVSEGVRLLQRSPERLPRAIRGLSAAAAAVAVIWCAAVLVVPDALGGRVLGATWHQAKPLLPLLGLTMVALAAALGPIQGLLSLGAAKRSLFTQVAGLAMQLPLVVGGAVLSGARGAAVGLALSTGMRTILAWGQFRRGFAEGTASGSVMTADAAISEAVTT